MNEIELAAEKFEKTISILERRFEDGITIDSVDSFRHFASAWYELGYHVGKHEVEVSHND